MNGRRTFGMLLLVCAATSVDAARPASAVLGEASPKPAEDLAAAQDLFASGRFAEATLAYEQALAGSAAPAALAGLARMRLYQHREAEAAELAQEALALAPDDPVANPVLKTVDMRHAAFAPDVYRVGATKSEGVADFVSTDPLPVVNVRIDGRTARFIVDTGAPDIALAPAFAQSLGLALTEGGVGTFAGGKQVQVQRTIVPQLDIGGVRITNVPAVINPAQRPGLRTDGVIGTGLMMHFLSTIDYCSGRLVLAPRSASAAFERRAARVGANIVPMWLTGDHFLFAQGMINRTEGLFNIDTGLAGGGLVATRATLDAAGIVPDEGKATIGQSGGGAVRFVPFRAAATLGTLTRDDVPGVYMADGDPYGMFRFRVPGALSHSFFRQSRVTFDSTR